MDDPEHRLQSRVRMYLTDALPRPGFFSSVDHARKQSIRSGVRQKARGIKKGLADVFIWYLGMFDGIELKVDSPVSEAQEGFGAAMRANGFRYTVIRSVTALDAHLRACGVPILPSMRIAAMNHDAALALATPPKPARTRKPRRYGPPKASAAAKRMQRARYGLPP